VQFYCAYTFIDPRTLAGAPPGTIWANVSQSNLAYWGALRAWWTKAFKTKTAVATFEHDVVLRPDVVEAFEDCPEPWCVFPYDDVCQNGTSWAPRMEDWRNQLGCTRFRAELVAAVPDALDGVPIANSGVPIAIGWDWHSASDGLGNALRAKKYTHHWHYPAVEHHHRRYLSAHPHR
jgi:hypothetical protein